jgi:hypothetical protein
MSNFQRDNYNMNNMQSQFLTLSIFDPIREDNIILYRNYNMLVKQGMSKNSLFSLKTKIK